MMNSNNVERGLRTFVSRRTMLSASLGGLLASPAVIPAWAGSAEKEIVVGQIASFSTPGNRQSAIELQTGVELALSMVNATGGINGHPIRLVSEDDGFVPAKTVLRAEELIQKHGAIALVGCLGSQTTLKLINDQILARNQIASFGPFTGLRQVQASQNVFPVRVTFDDEVRAMFFHAARLGRKKICFLYLKAGAGPDLSASAKKWADESGVNLLQNTGIELVASAAQQLLASEAALSHWGSDTPDAVVLIGFGSAQSNAITTLRSKYRTRVPIYALGQVNIDTLVAEIGKDAARGVTFTQVMPSPASVDREICREYATALQRWKPDAKPSYMMLEGFVAARVMANVLMRAKALKRKEVLEAALGLGRASVSDFQVQYSPEVRRSLQPVDITMLNQAGTLIR